MKLELVNLTLLANKLNYKIFGANIYGLEEIKNMNDAKYKDFIFLCKYKILETKQALLNKVVIGEDNKTYNLNTPSMLEEVSCKFNLEKVKLKNNNIYCLKVFIEENWIIFNKLKDEIKNECITEVEIDINITKDIGITYNEMIEIQKCLNFLSGNDILKSKIQTCLNMELNRILIYKNINNII